MKIDQYLLSYTTKKIQTPTVFVSGIKVLCCRFLKSLLYRSIFFSEMNIFCYMKQENMKVVDIDE